MRHEEVFIFLDVFLFYLFFYDSQHNFSSGQRRNDMRWQWSCYWPRRLTILFPVTILIRHVANAIFLAIVADVPKATIQRNSIHPC